MQLQGKWPLVTVDVTPAQPQQVGCCQGGARSNKQSRRVAAAVVVQCRICCWQIKSPEALNAVMLLDEHKIRGGRVSSPWPAPRGQFPMANSPTSHQFASSRAKTEHCRGWREQAGRLSIAGSRRVWASGEAPCSLLAGGGVLKAATLTQDWARGQAYSGAFNAAFNLVSCKFVCLL